MCVLTEHLALIPDSRCFGLLGGAKELQGWDAATIVLARSHNLIAAIVGGFSKDVNIDDLLIEFPGSKAAAPAAPQTLAELMNGSLTDFFGSA
ncbi:hypothetical protein [Microbacterium testaceum]|uniref:hypothetical protein n=1 Tax=Microbacterium testaceum TaxID=2033 RepID=UPI0027D8B4FB|nr:hypothetical protein [Microbacterium testaceum]